MTASEQDVQSRLRDALLALQKMRTRLQTLEQARREPIAIIGMGCRFPAGVNTPEQFWQFLLNGQDAITEVPRSRWDNDHYYDPDPDKPGVISTRWGGFIDQPIDRFDAKFFGISPREARSMDPQQRMVLEVAWETLEHAGRAPGALAGSQTGVFVGITMQDYLVMQANRIDVNQIDAYHTTGAVLNAAIGRISYILGLHGPCMAVDTACSSSLVSVHLAAQALRNGECDLALAGGVNVILVPEMTVSLTKAHMMSPDGHCKTFDASADGFVRSEGCGMVALKRLSDALADGDRIFAIVRGSAVNHGGSSAGFTVPNKLAQAALVKSALKSADIKPADVTYVETHGTGTSLGDPIEIRALSDALGEGRTAENPLLLGSAKTNFGHLEAGAGIVGLMKLVLAAYHGEIPPHLYLNTPNPYIPWNEMPMHIPTERTPWVGRRIGGVSSFGASGTNAHIIVEAPPETRQIPAEADSQPRLLTISAQTEAALRAYAGEYIGFLHDDAVPPLRDLTHTANTRRSHFDYRLAVAGNSSAEIAESLAAYLNGSSHSVVYAGHKALGEIHKATFVFSGQGPQWWAMGRELLETEPVFREQIEACDKLLRQYADWSLLEELARSEAESRLDQTAIAQPAIFALQIGLAALWASWGIRPDAVVGHSVGEIAAAHIAGVLSLEDAIRVVYHRARLMQAATGQGKMLSVEMPSAAAQELVAPYGDKVAVAAINSPTSTVLSGDAEALAVIEQQVAEQGIFHRMLPVNYAFHSPQMESYQHELARELKGLKPAKARLTLISTVTGLPSDGLDYTAEYWGRNIRQAVRFAPAIQGLAEQGYDTFLEIAPHPVLASVMEQCLAGVDRRGLVLHSLRRHKDERVTMLTALGALYAQGSEVNWDALYPDGGNIVTLPAYPWQRERYWIDLPARGQTARDKTIGALLERQVHSPTLKETVFETRLSADWPPFLADHRILGTVIASGTTLLELAAEAAVVSGRAGILSDFLIREPLVLPDGEERTLQVVIGNDNPASLSIYGLENGEWKQYALGTLAPAGDALLPDESLDAAQSRCSQPADMDAFYQMAVEHGMDFGPSFRGVERLWLGEGEAVAQVRLPGADSGAYRFHPAGLDACFHPILVLLGEIGSATYLPVSYEAFRQYHQPGSVVWSYTRLRHQTDDMALTDVCIWDEDGVLLAEVRGLRVKAASGIQGRPDWLYEVHWKPMPLPEGRPADAAAWLVFADSQGTGASLADQLHQAGDTAFVVTPGNDFAVLSPGHWQIDPANPRHYEQVVQAALAAKPDLSNIVHLWSLDAPDALPSAGQTLAGSSAIYTIQALARLISDGHLRLLTRGAQPVNGTLPQVVQAAVWGVGSVVSMEHPSLQVTRIDLDPDAAPDDPALLAEMRQADVHEPQVAFRGGARYAARLESSRLSPAAALLEGDQPFILDIAERGVLDNLTFRPYPRQMPGAGEIEIRVHATGLNFRDVLNALGMYPGEPGLLGNECAGEVVAVGSDVQDIRVGDRVMAAAYGTFTRYVTTPAALAIRIPDYLTYEEAATIPITYLTAYYALHHLAGMKAGDKVLIHAAAGGVGIAAVQLARRAGAEIFGTAGSPIKRDYLAEIGVQHCLNSRTLDFAEDIRAITAGQGVDIILNSLTGDFIPNSLSVLRPGGHFLEIGKGGIWDSDQVEAFAPGTHYAIIYLGDILNAQPDLAQSMLRDIVQGLEDGSLQPLPLQVFPLSEAVNAFRFMAQARHIGKIVLSQDVRRGQLSPDASYLITGGTSGIGLEVARWMVGQGARYLALASRRGMTPDAAALVEEMAAQGAVIQVFAADVAQESDVRGLLAEIATSLPPLRGIIHSAGVNADAPLLKQDAERLETVLRPKADGASYLSDLTRDLNLDFFVLFSSIATIIGWAGQSNYAAANACLDALAHQRRGQGLPATSINWGIWDNTGMTAVLSDQDKARWARQGLKPFSPAEGLNALKHILEESPAQTVATPINWRAFLNEHSSPFYEAFAVRSEPVVAAPPAQAALLLKLAETPPSRHYNVLSGFIRDQAVQVLGLEPGQVIDPLLPLNQLGLDSLMAVELRNALALNTGLTLPATLLFDYPTIDALVQYLMGRIEPPKVEESAAAPEPPPESSTDALAGLSDEEAEALLLEELARGKKKGKR